MRESSHFDGHQTTGYSRIKTAGLDGYACPRIAFTRRYWAGLHKPRYVDGLSIRGGAGFLGAGRSSPELPPRQRSDFAVKLRTDGLEASKDAD